MKKADCRLLVIVVATGLALPAGRAYCQGLTGFDYTPYARILKAYVDDSGMVDYRQLKANRTHLDTFVEAMAALKPEQLAGWDEQVWLCFYINAVTVHRNFFKKSRNVKIGNLRFCA